MNPAAILGKLPMRVGVTHRFHIPVSVVPPTAVGILVFAWAGVIGAGSGGVSAWHLSAAIPGSGENFFSLLVRTLPGAAATNSQAFWLPMPRDAVLRAILLGADLPATGNTGEVEIHGYRPA
jgi:hypothetical protein